MLETICSMDNKIRNKQDDCMLKIMIIDDSLESLEGMGEALALNEYPNTTFVSAQEAIAAYSLKPFDVVISDYKMPEMSGFDVCKAIKALNPYAYVIIISGYMDFEKLEQVYAYLHKPLDLGILIDILNKIKEEVFLGGSNDD